MPNDDGQDHMFRFIPLKEVDGFATLGEVGTSTVLHDVTAPPPPPPRVGMSTQGHIKCNYDDNYKF